LESVPVNPRGHFPVAAEAAVAAGVLNIVVAVAPGIPDNVAVTGGYKIAQSVLHHALVQMNARKSVVLFAVSLARSKAWLGFVVVVLSAVRSVSGRRPLPLRVVRRFAGSGVSVVVDSQPLVPASPRPETSSASATSTPSDVVQSVN
jgi:hypothetical protein